MRFLWTLVCYCCVPSVGVAAQNVPPSALSVEAAVQIAIRNNPRLAAAVREVSAARLGVRAAGALANPQIVFAPALTDGGSDEELLVQQPLEVNGARAARRGVALARQGGAEGGAVLELRGVVFATRAAYYELARAREKAALARDLLQTAGELDRLARSQVELGARPAIEETQTAIEVTRAKQQATLAEATVAAREAALNGLLNRPPDTPVGAVSLPPAADSRQEIPPGEEAERQALASRAEIQVGAAAAEAFRQEARLARAEGLPDIAPQFRASEVVGGVEDSGFGVAITLPLVDYGGRRGRIRQAQEAARAAEAVLQTYPDGLLEQAGRLLSASRIGYEEGRTSILALLEAQRTYRQVQSEFTDAKVARALALAELERATGAVPASLLSTVSPAEGRSNP